jgi:hypothetical protein
LLALLHKIALAVLKRTKQTRKENELVPIKAAKRVGIVYNALKLQPQELQKEKAFFANKGVEVYSLGFVDAKELTGFSSTYKDEYFCRKDLNFWKHVKPDAIKGFANEAFDYLLNLDTQGNLTLQSVSVLSKAKTRFGKQFDAYEFAHDFMVKSYADSPKELFREIVQYIK